MTGSPAPGAARGTGPGAAARSSDAGTSRTASVETSLTASAETSRTASDDTRRPSVTTAGGARTVRTARSARGADAGTGGSGRRPVVEPVTGGSALPEPASLGERTSDPAAQQPGATPVADLAGDAPVIVSVVPPAAAPAPVPMSPGRISAPRVVGVALPALPLAPDPRPGQPMTSLFGILGLLLIPLAGAALGYRQARAARSVGALPRT